MNQETTTRPSFILFLVIAFVGYQLTAHATPEPPKPKPRHPVLRLILRGTVKLVIVVAKIAPYALAVLPFVLQVAEQIDPEVIPDPPSDKTTAPTEAGILYEMRSQGPDGTPVAELNHRAGW